jgi:hypothetical protein
MNESDLSVTVQAGAVAWKMVPSSAKDLLIGKDGDEFQVRLAEAGEIRITPYETGFKTGVKMVLDRFRNTGLRSPGSPLDLRLVRRCAS